MPVAMYVLVFLINVEYIFQIKLKLCLVNQFQTIYVKLNYGNPK